MNKTRQLINFLIFIILYICICTSYAQAAAEKRTTPTSYAQTATEKNANATSNGQAAAEKRANPYTNTQIFVGKQTTGTQQLPGSQNGINIQSQDQLVKKGNIRLHQFRSESSIKLNNPGYQQKDIELNGNQYFALFEDSANPLCKQSQFRKCYLAVGHGYENNGNSDSASSENANDTFAIAYFGYNEADNYAIAFQSLVRTSQNWAQTFVHAADKTNPYNKNSDKEADCQKEIKLQDFQTTKSQYTQKTFYAKGFSNIITQKQQNYNFALLTQKDDIDQNDPCYQNPEQDTSLRGQGQITLKRTATKDVSLQLAAQYRRRIGAPNFISKSAIQKYRQQRGKLDQKDDGKQPNFSQIDNIDDPGLSEPIDFQKYFNGEGDFAKDYPQRTFYQRLLTIEQSSININNEQIKASRLLPVIATHTLYEQTKIIYSKVILGKKIEVKIYAKCQLIISVFPSKHQIQCFGQIIYQIFSASKTKNLFSFKKQVAANWNWSQNWGGNWGFNFGVPLPPPVSFITINFYVTISYSLNLSLYSQVKQWWYPLIHQVKAVISSQLNVDATASVQVVVIQGGVYIKGTIVKVSTDPTVTLYYALKPEHKYILVWIKWYWEIIAFQFEWGFKWRFWFFGWQSWQIIAKWNINGIYGKYKILNKAFFLTY